MDKQFLNSWTAIIVEVEEHITAATTINKEQEHARREITSARERLQGVHVTLHHQFLDLTESTDNLKRRFLQVREQFQSGKTSRDEDDQ